MKNQKGLGKGIGAILGSDKIDDILEGPNKNPENLTIEIPISQIEVNPLQPRESFDEESIKGLAESIETIGLINPITVRKEKSKYYIIAGERRFRACKLLGWDKIRVNERNISELENVSLALIENIQRENLNPLEEAKAYKLLISKFKLKQQDLASRVGKDRTTIANTLRLLNLPEEIQEAVAQGMISPGHARALLSLPNREIQIFILKEIIKKDLSVRQLEQLVREKYQKNLNGNKDSSKKESKDAHIKLLESELREKLGTKVAIQHKGEKGKLEIYFYSLDDFDRIRELLNSG